MQRNKRKTTSTAESKKTEQRVVNVGGSASNAPTKTKPTNHSAADDLATIDYQSIAGLKPKPESGNLDNKSLGGKKKSLEKLLADAEKKQQRLKELKKSAKDEDREKARNIEWGETLKVAG